MVRLWDRQRAKWLTTFAGHQAPVTCITFAPHKGAVLTGSLDGEIRLWQIHGETQQRLRRDPNEDQWTSIAAQLSIPQQAPRWWETTSGTLVRIFYAGEDAIRCLAYMPDSKTFVSGGDDARIRLWDGTRGKLLETAEAHTSGVIQVCSLPAIHGLASASLDGTLCLWDMPALKLRQTIHLKSPATAMTATRDGALLAVGVGGEIRLFNSRGRPGLRFQSAVAESISALAFSADGRVLAAGSGAGKIRLWETATGRLMLSLRGESFIHSLEFSADGAELLAGDSLNQALQWTLPVLDFKPTR
jgi:WD40 repeat protein